jgi:energy-converting hydrogenase Eha subunit A
MHAKSGNKTRPKAFEHRGSALFWISLTFTALGITALLIYLLGIDLLVAKANVSGNVFMLIGVLLFILTAFIYVTIDSLWNRSISRSAFQCFFANSYNEQTITIFSQQVDDDDLTEKLDSAKIFNQLTASMKNYAQPTKHHKLFPILSGVLLGLPVPLLICCSFVYSINQPNLGEAIELVAFASVFVGAILTLIFINKLSEYPPHNLKNVESATPVDENTNTSTHLESENSN